MRTLTIFLTAAASLLTFTARPVNGQNSKTVYTYPVKSAVIEYAYSGSSTGTETWYMDNRGKLTARYTDLTTKSFGSTEKSSQLVIQKDSVFFTIDLIEKTGVKTTIHLDPEDAEKWTKDAQKAWEDTGFKKIGEETLLGKPCEIWEGMSTKVWIWQNFALKSETSLFGKTVIEAKKIETGIQIPASRFEVPSDIKMTEASFNSSDPVFDSIGKDLEKGLKDLKEMFGPKKKK